MKYFNVDRVIEIIIRLFNKLCCLVEFEEDNHYALKIFIAQLYFNCPTVGGGLPSLIAEVVSSINIFKIDKMLKFV